MKLDARRRGWPREALTELIIFGASGYSGLELLHILSRHREVRVVGASASKWAGEAVALRVPLWRGDLRFEPHDGLLARAAAGQLAFLATPAETSADLAPRLLDRGLRIIDVSGAFRLKSPEAYPVWYGFEHPRPDLLAEAHYGLVDLFAPAPSTRLVANPGCYATAALLAAAPLIRGGLVSDGLPVFIDGKSGTTGAGRRADEALLHAEVAENLRPYRLARHQHTPEIEQTLTTLSGRPVTVSFTAHLVPMRRGIVASVYGVAAPNVKQSRCDEAFAAAYAGSAMVRYRPAVPPETGVLSGSNLTDLCAVHDPRAGTVSAFAALDNLVKGAAGQAVENLNLLLGLPRETALLPDLQTR